MRDRRFIAYTEEEGGIWQLLGADYEVMDAKEILASFRAKPGERGGTIEFVPWISGWLNAKKHPEEMGVSAVALVEFTHIFDADKRGMLYQRPIG